MNRSNADLDELADLEEQRDFLLRSLDDLDAEFASGEIERDEFHTLQDDYTRRAAEVLRAIEDGKRSLPGPTAAARNRNLLILAGILAFGVVAAIFVTQNFGRREANDFATGGVEQSLRTQVVLAEQARAAGDLAGARQMVDDILREDPFVVEAIVLSGHLHVDQQEILLALQEYDRALEIEPDDVDALTWRGWTLMQVGEPDLFPIGIDFLDRAVALDPSSFEPFVFRGAVARRVEADFALAIEMYEQAIDRGAPPAMVDQLSGLIEAMRAALDGETGAETGDQSSSGGAT